MSLVFLYTDQVDRIKLACWFEAAQAELQDKQNCSLPGCSGLASRQPHNCIGLVSYFLGDISIPFVNNDYKIY